MALLLAIKDYVNRFGLWANDTLPTIAGRVAEELLTVYRGKLLPRAVREALAVALPVCRGHASRGLRFRLAAALDAVSDTAGSP
jgi:hypothetical protein